MKDLSFHKLSGAGNDFVALVEPEAEGSLPLAELARLLCRRGLSIGADGLFVLARVQTPVASRAAGPPKISMVHFNADGGRAELCLNGTRCAAALSFHLGWADHRVIVATDAGEIAAEHTDNGVRMQVRSPTAPRLLSLGTPSEGSEVVAYYAKCGVPHVVEVCPAGQLDALDVDQRGRWIRQHRDLQPEGANANFVEAQADSTFRLRTFERGVEGETLACGTGAVASASVLKDLGHAGPFHFLTRGAYTLSVDVEEREDEERWFLEGDARLIASGTVAPGALVENAPGKLPRS